VLPFQLLIAARRGWLQREQAHVIAFLREENRILQARVAGQRLRSMTVSVAASPKCGTSLVDVCSGRSRPW
jgi:hypothetical protein